MGHLDQTEAESFIDLPALKALVTSIERYPVASIDMLGLARQQRAPRSVVNFFESILGSTVFSSQDDVMTRAEEDELLLEEDAEQVAEHLRSYDD